MSHQSDSLTDQSAFIHCKCKTCVKTGFLRTKWVNTWVFRYISWIPLGLQFLMFPASKWLAEKNLEIAPICPGRGSPNTIDQNRPKSNGDQKMLNHNEERWGRLVNRCSQWSQWISTTLYFDYILLQMSTDISVCPQYVFTIRLLDKPTIWERALEALHKKRLLGIRITRIIWRQPSVSQYNVFFNTNCSLNHSGKKLEIRGRFEHATWRVWGFFCRCVWYKGKILGETVEGKKIGAAVRLLWWIWWGEEERAVPLAGR